MLNSLKDSQEAKARDDPDAGGLLSSVRLLSFLASFLIVFINGVLRIVIRTFSTYEKHMTYTKFHLSVAFKFTMAFFINSAVLPLLLYMDTKDWFIPGGLVVDASFTLISVGFIGPFTYIFDPFYIIRLCKRRSEKKKGEKS